MQIVADIDGQSETIPTRDKDGRAVMAVVTKYTYSVTQAGHAELVREDAPRPYFADECWGDDPATSSIKKPSDSFEFKPGTDVILLGHAHPDGNASEVDVAMRVGAVKKRVRAYGLRVWQRDLLGGICPGPAQPIREPVPLRYELAWGGSDTSDPARPLGEPTNYVGRGVARDSGALIGTAAAQLEDPAQPLSGRKKVPWCFGAIHRHWKPRRDFGGTYDDSWMESRMPLLPADFDSRFHVTVPHDQWSPVPLRSDEPVEILGATPSRVWRFALPRVAIGVFCSIQGRRTILKTHLDTFLVDADNMRVELTWRASFPLPRKWEMVDFISVTEKEII